MDLTEFYDRIEEHAELEGVKVLSGDDAPEGKPGAVIRHTPTGICTQASIDAIKSLDWPTIEEIVTCRRDPDVVYSMTRVVGYFAREINSNKSRRREYADRRKGHYEVPA